MAQNQRKDRKNKRPSRAGMQAHRGGSAPDEPVATPIPPAPFVAGLLGLAAAIVGSGMLAWSHLTGINAPGCGPDSGCAEAARSAWGSVPGLGWPTSHIGLAFFVGMTVAWIAIRLRGLTAGFLWLARVGALISIALTAVMFINGYVCQWCLLTHGGNLLFWITAEVAMRQAAAQRPLGVKAAVGAALMTTAVLIPVELVAQSAAQQKLDEQRRQSVENIISTPDEQRQAFTGRYLYGPEEAAMRIVAFTDYQCEDCQRFERELRGILEQRDDISLSIKQFPMSNKCNKYLPTNMHNNACMAARAAEAAGILQGNDGFWKMHFWLFDVGGEFTDATFASQLRELGFNPKQFIDVMTGERTLELVQQDIEEGYNLGLYFTPLVYINGVELRNAHIQGNLTRAIDEIAARHPEPKSVDEALDTPPTAREKFVNDWLAQPQFPVAEDTHAYPLGPDDPVVDIVMWGDHQEETTAQHNTIIRERMQLQAGIRYNFRFYPMSSQCNEFVDRIMHAQACMAARAVEAGGMLQGEDGWWTMHDSMFANRNAVSMQLITDLADYLEWDNEVLVRYMQSAYVDDAIAEDIMAARRHGLRGIPTIIVNGRKLPRLTIGGEAGLPYILDHLLGKVPPEDLQEFRRKQAEQRRKKTPFSPRQEGGRTYIPVGPRGVVGDDK